MLPARTNRSRQIGAAALALAMLLILGLAGWLNFTKPAPSAWSVYNFPARNYDGVSFRIDRTAYRPDYLMITAQLTNDRNVEGLACGEPFQVVKQAGEEWRAVPFRENLGFNLPAHTLSGGAGFDYHIRPDLLAVRLGEGRYRIVTDVMRWEEETHDTYIIWAEFTIDRNAEKQETVKLYWGNPCGKEMTLDDLRGFAGRFSALSLQDMSAYWSYGCGTHTSIYQLDYPVSDKYRLGLYSDTGGHISRLTLTNGDGGDWLDLLTEADHLEEFLGGAYKPRMVW